MEEHSMGLASLPDRTGPDKEMTLADLEHVQTLVDCRRDAFSLPVRWNAISEWSDDNPFLGLRMGSKSQGRYYGMSYPQAVLSIYKAHGVDSTTPHPCKPVDKIFTTKKTEILNEFPAYLRADSYCSIRLTSPQQSIALPTASASSNAERTARESIFQTTSSSADEQTTAQAISQTTPSSTNKQATTQAISHTTPLSVAKHTARSATTQESIIEFSKMLSGLLRHPQHGICFGLRQDQDRDTHIHALKRSSERRDMMAAQKEGVALVARQLVHCHKDV